jgi:aspartokinase-like uncharacterized kinase
MSREKVVLIKVGGSLYSLGDLAKRLQLLFAATGASRVLVVPGGGEVTDFVRDWDQVHSLATDASHQLAIDSLGLTARLLARVLPEASLAREEPIESSPQKVSILDVPAILASADCQECSQLPSGWHVTSDSIAAWIAIRWRVDELILAKSVGAPDAIPAASDSPQDEDSSGAVDSCFGRLIPGLPPLFWCNLRGDPSELFAFEKAHDGSSLSVLPPQ